ncbi:MAG: hypothetical protein QT10_C0001G0034 [archaeon GW2011_AR19]|nr:MAG: hypothetical protein QT10_C0001G0034 [archaeon GW2011_AR19]
MTSIRKGSKEQLVEYFKKNLKKGYTTDSLKWALINQGYSRVIVEESLNEAQKEMAKEAPILKEKPRINYQVLDKGGKPLEIA